MISLSKADRTRRFIISKVAPIFNKKGYAATSLKDMTMITGLTKGSIYGNFKDKDEVALEAFRYNLKELTYKLNQRINKEEGAINQLNTYLDYYLENFQTIFDNGGCSILNTATEVDDTHPLLKKEVCQALMNWQLRIERILEEGIVSGELKAVDKERFSCLFVSVMEGTILLSKTLNKPQYVMYNFTFLKQQIKDLEA